MDQKDPVPGVPVCLRVHPPRWEKVQVRVSQNSLSFRQFRALILNVDERTRQESAPQEAAVQDYSQPIRNQSADEAPPLRPRPPSPISWLDYLKSRPVSLLNVFMKTWFWSREFYDRCLMVQEVVPGTFRDFILTCLHTSTFAGVGQVCGTAPVPGP